MTKNTNSTVKVGSTSHACAACKYQRRKCSPNCPLAPFFPPDRQQDFLNAHKLFGVSNILKTIKDLPPVEKQSAMSSIIFQANARARDPVGGCERIIVELKRRICSDQKELYFVRQQLAYYKSLNHNNNESNNYDNNAFLVEKGDENGDGFDLQSIGNGQSPPHDREQQEPSKIADRDPSKNPPRTHQEQQEHTKIADREPTKNPPRNHQEQQEPTKIADREKLSNQEKPKTGENKFDFGELSPSSAEEQSCHLADISEDVKPFLGGFDERDNTIFFDSNKVMLKDEDQKKRTI